MTALGLYMFYLELLAAQLMTMRRVARRKFFPLRMILALVVALPFRWLPILHIGFFGISFIMITVYAAFAAAFMYDTNALHIIFCTLAAFAMQHIASSIVFIMQMYITDAPAVVESVMHIVIFAAAYLVLFLAFGLRGSDYEVGREKLPAIVICSLILVITCLMNDLVELFGGWTVLYRVYAVICCIFALGTQYGMMRSGGLESEARRLENEKATVNGMLLQEKKQHELSAETIEMINLKCHDLKKQISVLRGMGGEEAEKQLRDIERSVMIYGDIAKTGDPALDIVLTEKSLLCEKRGVRFTYIADGASSLGFMEAADIAAFFGNALDNAIERASVEPEDKRVVRMNISRMGDIMRVRVENYCSEPLKFERGLPVTTKEDKRYHGYGTRSIVRIAEKYGGTVVMEQSDGMFRLGAALPIASEADKERTSA